MRFVKPDMVLTSIRYVTLHCRERRGAARRGAASFRYINRADIIVIMCENSAW